MIITGNGITVANGIITENAAGADNVNVNVILAGTQVFDSANANFPLSTSTKHRHRQLVDVNY